MASPIRGITIEINGDATPLTQALRSVDDASRGTTRELGQINRALRFDEGNTTLLAQRFDVLQDAVRNTEGRLQTLRSAQEDVNRAFASGDIDASQFREFERQIAQTESTLRNFQQQAENTRVQVQGTVELSGLERVRNDLGQLGEQARDAGREIGAGIAAGAAVGVAALSGLAAEGQDLAQRLGALEATADTLGFDTSAQGIRDLAVEAASYTGDLEGAVEAVSNLTSTDLSQGQLQPTLELLTGAALQFKETLSLEGIADGFQETLAIGEGAGSFIEFLERSGVNLEEFNESLAAAREQGTDLDFVLGVLGGTNAQGVVDAFRDQNAELIASQKAQAEFAVATSELSTALAPLLTVLAELATSVVTFLGENEELARVLAVVLGAVTLLAGAFALLAPIIGTIITFGGTVAGVIAAIATPIGVVIAAVGLLTAAFLIIPKIIEPIGEYFSNFFGDLETVFNAVVDGIKSGFQSLVGFVKTPINAIIGVINNLIRGLNKIKLPDFLGGYGVNLPEIPRFARGTNYFRGGTALVGEEGPELVNLPGGSSVVNARNTSRALQQDNQPIQISIPVMLDGRQVASATALYTNREIYNLSENARRGGRRR